jgi:hypothetical protein
MRLKLITKGEGIMESHRVKNWYDKKAIVVLLLVFFSPVGIYALWKNSEFPRKTKVILSAGAALLIILGISRENLNSRISQQNHSFGNGSYSSKSPVGRWTYDDFSSWHYELRILSSGKYILAGPPGTDFGSWTGSNGDLKFYLEGIPVATGYRNGDYFYYNAGRLGTMEMIRN